MRVREPRAGVDVVASDVAAAVEPVLAEAGQVTVQVDHRVVQPAVGREDVAAVLPAVRRAVAAPVRLRNPGGDADLELLPGDIAMVLSLRSDQDAPPGQRLRIVADSDQLREVIGPHRLA